MFIVESLGLPNEETQLVIMIKKNIEQFEKFIKYKGNFYSVKLPCDKEKNNSVPSNCAVAFNVLNRIVKKIRAAESV